MKFSMFNIGQYKNLATKIGGYIAFVSLILLVSSNLSAQTTLTFNYTGAPQYYTIPPCVTTITITAAGADGGGALGGNGATVSGVYPVVTGQVIQINVGGSGVVLGGWNGGGNGQATTLPSSGGGGATDIRLTPYALGNRVIVAGGGGGAGGGSPSQVAGGAGGCATGGNGTNAFGTAGTGGSQTTGGTGGNIYANGANGGTLGSPGTLGVGGAGGIDQCTSGSSGGGGGGGYYGGGGGGPDCISSTSFVGGAGGGGGSSLTPAGFTCVQGNNNGNGYVTIVTGSTVQASNTGPYCEGSTIQLNSSPGTTHSWTGPNGFTSTLQNPTIPNAVVGDTGVYSVVITGVGCLAAASTTVMVTPAIFPNAGIDDTVCFGSAFSLVGTTTIATDPFSWTYYAPTIVPAPGISFAPASNVITPSVMVTQPGHYNFILTEVNPVCGIVRDTVAMFVKQMDVQTVFNDPSCFGLSDGTINATGTDATEFSFDGGITWGTTQATGLPAGIYSVCARVVNQCQACMQVTLTDPPAVILSTSNDTLICENGTATLQASAINGNGFVYNWTQFTSTNDTQYGSPAVDTYYTVQAMSGSGCFSNTDSIFVTVRPPISGTISPDASICPGYNTLQTVTALDGIGAPYTFTWSDGTIGTGASHSYMVSPPVTQPYSVTITDACESTPLTLTNTITVDPIPVPSFISDAPELCEPAEFEVYVTTNPADYVTASWLLSDGQFYTNTDTIQTSPMMEGSYSVQLVLTNQFGCIDSVTMANYLVSHPLPISKFKFYPGAPTMFATDVQFTNFSVNAASSAWTFESGDPATSADMDPETTFPEGEVGFYDVELIVTSDFGCLDTSMQTVEVKPEVLLYAPNTFTPDGDEFNPNWRVHIVGIDVQEFQLEIRNRWGELIWESHDVDAEWDGSYHNEQVPNGTYNWFIRAKDIVTDEPYIFKGHVNVMK